MIACPKCESPEIMRSRARGAERLFKSLTSYRAYRCSACKWRGWLQTGKSPWLGVMKTVKRAAMLIASALLIGLATWLIARALS